MSRESRRRRRELEEEFEDEGEAEAEVERDEPRGRSGRRASSGAGRWLRRLLFLLVILGVAAWFAPLAVTKFGLQRALDAGTAELNGSVSAESASFGWLSPVQVQNLVLRDQQGEPVLTIPSATSEKPLWQIATGYKQPGVMRIEKPSLRIALRPDGSNLEDILAPLQKLPVDAKGGDRVAVGIEIVDGSAEITDVTTGRKWVAEKLNCFIQTAPNDSQPLAAKVQANIKPAGDADGGELAADVVWVAGVGEPGIGEGKLSLKTKTLGLEILEPVLRRFVGEVASAGWLTSDVACEWNGIGEKAKAPVVQARIAQLTGDRLRFAAPKFLGRDALYMQRLHLNGQADVANQRCELKKFVVESDIAKGQADGAFALNAFASGNVAASLLSLLQNEDLQLQGDVDLAQLAKMLPGTLRVREGTEIRSGSVGATLVSSRRGEQRRWDGRVTASNFTAVDRGQTVTWEKPVDITLAAVNSAAGPVIENLTCDSNFLRLSAKGTFTQGEVSLSGDLDQLATELDRFFDLAETRLAGKLQGGIEWRQQANRQIDAQGRLDITDLQIARPGIRPWTEKQLQIALNAAGVARDIQLESIERATIEVSSGADRMVTELLQPVARPTASSAWPVRCQVVGELATWLPRVQAFLPLAGLDISGGMNLNESCIISPTSVVVEKGRLDIQNLRVIGNGLFLQEPQVIVELQETTLDPANAKILAKVMTLASSAIALRADNVAVQPTAAGTSVSATVGYRSDLERLGMWFQNPAAPVTQKITGQAVGHMKVVHTGDTTDAQFQTEVTDLLVAAAAPPSAGSRGLGVLPGGGLKPAWSEPKLTLSGAGTYQLSKDLFNLSKFQIAGQSLSVSASGTLAEPSRRCVVDVQGDLGYDLQTVALMLRPYLGESFDIAGRDTRQFALRGPLREMKAQTTSSFDAASRLASLPRTGSAETAALGGWPSDELAGKAGLAWKSAQAYGMPIGAGELQASLTQGVLKIEPLNLVVSEGRLLFAPRMLLKQDPMLVVADRGPVLDQVRLSPELCSQWLKYVTPIVADVTQVDGRVSLALTDQAVIPASDPLGGRVRGELTIHNAQVGPGPLAQELLWLVQGLRAIIDRRPLGDTGAAPQAQWLNLPEQKVPFDWRDRRVYHEGLRMAVRDIVITTRGSVGTDQSLDLLAEIPIRDEWISRDKIFGAAMQGQTIKVPIGGTVIQPRLDRNVLRQLTAQTVGNLLENGLNRGLERLLQPKK